MTAIIGMEYEGKVYIGGDSEYDYGWQKNTGSFKKVFCVQQHFLIGCAGEMRMINLMKHHLQVRPQEEGESDEHYIIVGLMDAVRQCFKTNGYSVIANNKETAGTFLVGYHGKLYLTGSEFDAVHHENGIAAIGSGNNFALGALHALNCYGPDEADPDWLIRRALSVAGQTAIGVSGPYYVEVL